MKTLLENWRELKEQTRGPADFHYKIIESPLKKEIQVLDLRNKQPLPGKAKGDAKIIIEKRTDVPHWQVTWSNSPQGTEGIGTIMYLMAMELAGYEGLAPDDYEQSDDALRVWAKFMPKDNIHGISKEKKEEFKYEGDENPFFFVFFKPDESVLRQFSVETSYEDVEKPEIVPPEEDIRPFDPEDPEEWEFLDDLQESLDENDTKNVSKVLIFNKNDEILLLKRADEQQNWDLPGGHIQKGENFVDGAKRETKEETNLEISGLKPVKTDKKDRIVKYFKANKYNGKISLDPEEHIDYKWVKIEDLDQYTVIKRMKSVIEAEMKALMQEIGRYQKKVARKHRRMKIRLIGKGKNKHNVGKKMKKPSYKRSKSAPPGAGGT